jgi:hypothetical protein
MIGGLGNGQVVGLGKIIQPRWGCQVVGGIGLEVE